jgi:hypothetical protein
MTWIDPIGNHTAGAAIDETPLAQRPLSVDASPSMEPVVRSVDQVVASKLASAAAQADAAQADAAQADAAHADAGPAHPAPLRIASPAFSHDSSRAPSPGSIHSDVPVKVVTVTVTVPPSGYGCGAALSYLAANAAPGFHFECPGYALGHQAMTCIDVAGVCSGTKLIAISDPCPAAYMNEASNSWVLEGLRQAPIDPFGYCH